MSVSNVQGLIINLSFAAASLLFHTQCLADSLTVAVAANFTATMKVIAAEFEQVSGHRLQLVTGSSGKLYAQIKNGAPFHVFFSADQQKPKALEEEGMAVPNSRFTYALGRLVLVSNIENLAVDGGAILHGQHYASLAMANPKLAPYGKAAVDVLSNLGLEQSSRSKWIQGENIAQAFQFVSSGNTDLGFISLAQLQNNTQYAPTSRWLIPSTLHEPIRQDAVILSFARKSSAAQALMQFVRGDRGASIILEFGYQLDPAFSTLDTSAE